MSFPVNGLRNFPIRVKDMVKGQFPFPLPLTVQFQLRHSVRQIVCIIHSDQHTDINYSMTYTENKFYVAYVMLRIVHAIFNSFRDM